MISRKHKFLFIHPAKTGGNSIEVALAPYADGHLSRYGGGFDPENVVVNYLGRDVKHAKLDFYCQHIREQLLDFYVFATTRNPWDRMVSAWSYYNKAYAKRPFNDWILFVSDLLDMEDPGAPRKYLRKVMDPVMAFMETTPGANAPPIHFIEFDSLQKDFDKVCQDIGIPRIELPHTLKTKHKHYSTYYNEEQRDLVAKAFAQDIKRFDYRFEEAK